MPRSKGSELSSELEGTATAKPSVRELTRITVSLAAKAAADLRRTINRTHLSQTDVVNRALSMYEFIDSELDEGAEIILRKDGKDHVVKIL